VLVIGSIGRYADL